MDQQAASLLSNLKRPAVSSDSKVNALNSLKSDIKHYRVPESAQPTIFECLKLAITQQTSAHLAASAFSTLGHLLKRLSIQDASGNSIQQLVPRILPVLQERMGDLREPLRACASQSLSDIYPYLGSDVERIVREEALGGNHARQKETAIGWVVRMHNEQGMAFKSYVGPIVACLENADEHVRDAAKHALVELFSSASERAKADLKKQLKAYAVRHGIEQFILAQIGVNSRPAPPPQEPDTDMLASTRSLPALDHVAAFAETLNSEAAKPPPVEVIPMDPIYMLSERELSDTMRDMLPHFEGKETEHNWMPRDKAVLKIRRLLMGNSPTEYHQAFMAGIKSLIDGILKVANTLRTTMSTNGCQCVQELMKTLGSAMDTHTEILLQSFIKMSSATKHIASENGRQTADVVFQHCTYNSRVMQHIWNAYQDKNASTRQCATEWIQTVLKRQAGYKSHFESSGGLELAEKCIKRGLDDANPKVKERTRAVYWTFAKTWPEKANAIMDKLDPKARGLLEKDSNNPNAALHGGSTSSTTGPATRPGGRSTLKELMAEQRRAKSAARNLPERSSSAMANLTPSKPKPELRAQSRGPSKLRSENRATSTASHAPAEPTTNSKGSSLMSGPVRRPRRPEIQRPQTADPYASRRLLRPETPANGTPSNNSPKGTGASKGVPTTSASRNRAKTAAQTGPSREASPSIPRRSPLPGPRQVTASRPSSKSSNAPPAREFSAPREDDFTMVLPSGRDNVGHDKRVTALSSARPALDKTTSVDSGIPSNMDEDNFTMVMPSLGHSLREGSPLNYRSPMKGMFEEARERLDRPASSHSRKQSDPFFEMSRKSPVSRRSSPAKSGSPQDAEVQIYEDPEASDRADTPANDERQVLSELPLNENVRAQSPTHSVDSHTSPAGSPIRQMESRSPGSEQDRTEALRNRRLLTSGIERIRNRALDAHGFRRVQELAKCQLDIWDSGAKYDELMSVLLEYLRSFPTDSRLNQLPSSKSAGLKTQALSVMRALLTLQRKYAGAWHANALISVLVARQAADSAIVSDIERTVDEIIKIAPPTPCIEAVNEHLSSGTLGDETASARSTALSLNALRALLLAARSRKTELSPELQLALARTSARYLEDADAEVRKADVELACEVFTRFGDEKSGFWSEFKGVEEGRLGLLTYYIARKERAS
jgi:CLIP-associating protein 1/2